MWGIIITAIFVILCHNALSFRHGWHRQWRHDFHGHGLLRDNGMPYNIPVFGETNGPHFFSRHPHYWGHGPRNHGSSSREHFSTENKSSKENGMVNSRQGPHEIYSPKFFPHHPYHWGHGPHNHDSSSHEHFSAENKSSKESGIENSRPSSQENHSPEFFPHHPHHWGHGPHSHDSFDNHRDSSSRDGSSEERNVPNIGGPDSPEMNSAEFWPHHKHHLCRFYPHYHKCHDYGDFVKIPTTTTTSELPTKELTTEPTTENIIKPTMKFTTESTTVSTTEFTAKSTTVSTIESIAESTIASTTESITTEPATESAIDPTEKRTAKPITTTESTTETTTDINQVFLNCIRLCPITPEYNPVCGTNFVTYTNRGSLICAQRCGLDVKVLMSSACPRNIIQSSSTSQSPLATNIPQSSSTSQSPVTTNIQQSSSTSRSPTTNIPQSSSSQAPVTTNIQQSSSTSPSPTTNIPQSSSTSQSPVTTNIPQSSSTSQSPVTTNIQSSSTIQSLLTTNIPQTSSTSQSPTTTTTAKVNTKTPSETQSQQECIKSCDSSTEFRPVCGSNDVTYKNGQHLMCAQFCGVEVKLKSFLPCTGVSTEPTITSTTVRGRDTDWYLGSNIPIYTKYCIKGCPVTLDSNPVCGTDDVTYKNPSVVQCLITCGIKVQIKHKLPCPPEDNTGKVVSTTPSDLPSTTAQNKSSEEICIDECVKNAEYKPVCGSNNVTYRNVDHLQCAKSCQVNVQLQTFFACQESSVVPESTSSENPGNVLTTSTTSAPEFTNGPKDQKVTSSVPDKNSTTTEAGGIDLRFAAPS